MVSCIVTATGRPSNARMEQNSGIVMVNYTVKAADLP